MKISPPRNPVPTIIFAGERRPELSDEPGQHQRLVPVQFPLHAEHLAGPSPLGQCPLDERLFGVQPLPESGPRAARRRCCRSRRQSPPSATACRTLDVRWPGKCCACLLYSGFASAVRCFGLIVSTGPASAEATAPATTSSPTAAAIVAPPTAAATIAPNTSADEQLRKHEHGQFERF